MKELLFSVLAVLLILAVGCAVGVLAGLVGTRWDPLLAGAVFTALVAFVQLGAGIRHLLTGMARDIAEIEKVRLEVEHLRLTLEKERSHVSEPTPEAVVKYGLGELLWKHERWERGDVSFKGRKREG